MTPGKRKNCLDGRILSGNIEGEPLDIVAKCEFFYTKQNFGTKPLDIVAKCQFFYTKQNFRTKPLDIVASQVYLRCRPVSRQQHLVTVGLDIAVKSTSTISTSTSSKSTFSMIMLAEPPSCPITSFPLAISFLTSTAAPPSPSEARRHLRIVPRLMSILSNLRYFVQFCPT